MCMCRRIHARTAGFIITSSHSCGALFVCPHLRRALGLPCSCQVSATAGEGITGGGVAPRLALYVLWLLERGCELGEHSLSLRCVGCGMLTTLEMTRVARCRTVSWQNPARVLFRFRTERSLCLRILSHKTHTLATARKPWSSGGREVRGPWVRSWVGLWTPP